MAVKFKAYFDFWFRQTQIDISVRGLLNLIYAF